MMPIGWKLCLGDLSLILPSAPLLMSIVKNWLIVLLYQYITHNFSKNIQPPHFDMAVLSRCNHTIIRYKCKVDYLDKDLFCFCEFLAMEALVCGVHIWQAEMWSLLMVTQSTKRWNLQQFVDLYSQLWQQKSWTGQSSGIVATRRTRVVSLLRSVKGTRPNTA